MPGGFSGGRRGGKIGGFAIIAIIAALLLRIDPTQILSLLGDGTAVMPPARSSPARPGATPADEQGQFAATILASTEDAWNPIFASAGSRYQPPVMVLFDEGVESACGFNSSATGPFYCPGDSQVYLDLSFFRQLAQLGAPGDFATAYVIAHEVGHHIQNLVGTEEQVRAARGRMGQADGNALSVRVELQADCYSGIWANHVSDQRDFLDSGDIAEGLQAAAAIGDDRLQQRSGGRVRPESFTHGTSAQRQEWFTRGLRSGAFDSCDTFST
ncbi:MAG: putative metalloprotease [Rhodothermales bacterium]|jgi:predicted metalloprotease